MNTKNLIWLCALALACGDDDSGTGVDAGMDTAVDAPIDTTLPDTGADEGLADTGTEDSGVDLGPDDTGVDMGAPACEGDEPICVDEQIIQLSLVDRVTMGAVDNTPAEGGDGFVTVVDASAGGFPPSEGYVYVRFTDEGLERVDIDDEAAFESTEWDMALRRFVIRLNSGVSGPGCVEGGRTAGGTEFDTLTEVPEGIPFRAEAYFTPDCGFVSDGSGIGAPGTALSSYWQYPGCVQMTGNVFVVALADGRHVKLRVDTYYSEEQQAACDMTGSLSDGPSGSGNVTIRWAFL